MKKMIFNYNITKYYNISEDIKCFLYVIFLKESGAITDEKFRGMLSSHREGTLNTHRKTYHCKINDKWYDTESMVNILADVCEHKVASSTSIPFESMIRYVNLFLNKNRNYCIDYIFTTIIKPIIQNYDGYNQEKILGLFDLKPSYNLTKPDDSELESGHCCEDCDGDIEQYKVMRYEYYYLKNNKKAIEQTIREYLLTNRRYGNPKTPEFNIF